MSDFGWGVLAVFAAAAALAAASIFLAWAWTWSREWSRERRRGLDELAIRRLGSDLASAAWWLSEHPPTQLALHLLAQQLMARGGIDISRMRDEWRTQLAQDKEPT